MGQATDDAVAAGREALQRHDWQAAYETLTEADRQGSLSGEGLELLAAAAYWSAHPEETVEALERAYSAYLKEGDRAAAALAAFRVAEQQAMRVSLSQAQGWAARAERLGGEDQSWLVHGYLEWMRGLFAWFQGEFEMAMAHYDRAMEVADRTGNRNLHAMTLHDKGHALCVVGRVADGMRLMDDAMAAVVGGELDPEAAGYVYCGMIGACSKLGDYGRAAEWTEATLRWCERQSIPAFPGVCRVHKAELMRLHGSFTQAEEEARLACGELPRYNLMAGLGPANYEIGEVRRRVGDFQGADEAYARAHEFGFDPQPGVSLLRLAQGKTKAAAAGIREAIAGAAGNHCLEIRLLAAQVDIAVAVGDMETAERAVARLDDLIEDFDIASLNALTAGARGTVRLAQGDPSGALREIRRAMGLWQSVDAPYEVAELRRTLAEAHRALEDEDAAAMEARLARDTFERLGAGPAAQRAAALLRELTPSPERPERVERAFMFTDIVKSTDLVGLIGDEAWEDLLAWHDQTLRSLFASHGGEVAHHTGDGFFVAFADTRSALECGVAVQRALVEHRRTHGFAPVVRIGVHTATATRRGEDYSGGEVHKAARVAALAEGGEILATAETAAAADGTFNMSDPQTVQLKGVAEPVQVTRISWR